jgi:hypothetical protein
MSEMPSAGNDSGQTGNTNLPDQPDAIPEKTEMKPIRRTGNSSWIFGLVLILIGVAFFLQNFNLLQINNWWALFLLIPAIGSFISAYENYRFNGKLTRSTRGSLIGGLILLFLTGVFLFGLDLGTLWPIILVIGGLSLLLGGLLPE